MLATGDLVRITRSDLQHFAGELALVNYAVHPGEDPDDHDNSTTRYLVTLADTYNSHIFTSDALTLVSKVQKNND